jgi:hypothetical protein
VPPNNSQDEQLIAKMRSLTVDARYIQGAMMNALKRFSERATPVKLLEGLRTKPNLEPLEELTRPRAFCYGALLLQSNNNLDGAALATDPTLYFLGFTCKFCNLEIGDYRMSKSGKTLISTRILARSHVTSCASFLDRRAFYKCLACYAKHGDVDFSSAEALERHLEKHPRKEELPAYLEGEDLADELNIDEQNLNLGSADDEKEDEADISLLQDGLESIDQGLQLVTGAVEGAPFQDSAVSSLSGPPSTFPSSNAPWASPDGMDMPSALPTDDYMNRGGVSRPEAPTAYQQAGQSAQTPGSVYSQQQQQTPPQNLQSFQQSMADSRTSSFTGSVNQQHPNPQPYPSSRQASASSYSPAAQSTASLESTRPSQRPNPNMNNYDDGYHAPSHKKEKEHSGLRSVFSSNKDKRK